jgi:hypothetical protein
MGFFSRRVENGEKFRHDADSAASLRNVSRFDLTFAGRGAASGPRLTF